MTPLSVLGNAQLTIFVIHSHKTWLHRNTGVSWRSPFTHSLLPGLGTGKYLNSAPPLPFSLPFLFPFPFPFELQCRSQGYWLHNTYTTLPFAWIKNKEIRADSEALSPQNQSGKRWVVLYRAGAADRSSSGRRKKPYFIFRPKKKINNPRGS